MVPLDRADEEPEAGGGTAAAAAAATATAAQAWATEAAPGPPTTAASSPVAASEGAEEEVAEREGAGETTAVDARTSEDARALARPPRPHPLAAHDLSWWGTPHRACCLVTRQGREQRLRTAGTRRRRRSSGCMPCEGSPAAPPPRPAQLRLPRKTRCPRPRAPLPSFSRQGPPSLPPTPRRSSLPAALRPRRRRL